MIVLGVLKIFSMSSIAHKRIAKELQAWTTKTMIDGVSIESHEETGVPRWILRMEGAPGSLYAGETYRVQIKFSDKYPWESPEVVFLRPSPEHYHIYSNGHICLDVLYDGWSATMNVRTMILSIMSMMSSAEEKGRPEGDLDYCESVGDGSPKDTAWDFHDDKA